MTLPLFPSLAFLEGLGGPEMVVIFVIVLILFGGKKMPEFARGLGKTMREFKKAASGVEEEFRRAMDEKEREERILPPPAVDATKSPTLTITPAQNTQPHTFSDPAAEASHSAPSVSPPKMMPPENIPSTREDDGHFS